MNLNKLKNKLNNEAEVLFEKLGIEYETYNDNMYSTCPVHEDSDNPRAFSFSPEKGIWKCWTRDCQHDHGNDIFGLITAILSNRSGEQLEFKDALRWICKEFNIDNKYDGNKEPKELEDEFTSMIKYINQQYQKYIPIKDKPMEIKNDYSVPSQYFWGRGFNKATLKYFGVGDCDEKGIMKDRAIIPIHNDDGKCVVGLIGRSIKEYRMPKFLFYPTGFDKRCYFYNFHRAVSRAKETSCLYLLEGQGDVWRIHEAGVKNAVGIFGKTISCEQFEKIKKLPVTHLVVLTDNDQAGRQAKVEIQRKFGRMYKLTFPVLSNKDVGDMTVKNIKEKILVNLKGTY